MSQLKQTNPVRCKPHGVRRVWLAVVLAGGCQTTRPEPATLPSAPPSPSLGLTVPSPLPSVRAVVAPPVGWHPDPLKTGSRTTHQVWISPSGHTAFGVIHFTMPLPVSASFLLPFYMRAWRKDQGESTLLSKNDDPALPGVRFVAEGGRYKTWSNLIVSGNEGWSVYAGVVRSEPVSRAEFDLAEAAREHTRVGLPGE